MRTILGFFADALCGSTPGIVVMAVMQELMLYCGGSCRVSLCTQFLSRERPEGTCRKEPNGEKLNEQMQGRSWVWPLGSKIILS